MALTLTQSKTCYSTSSQGVSSCVYVCMHVTGDRRKKTMQYTLMRVHPPRASPPKGRSATPVLFNLSSRPNLCFLHKHTKTTIRLFCCCFLSTSSLLCILFFLALDLLDVPFLSRLPVVQSLFHRSSLFSYYLHSLSTAY
jgi:hypothetical protein